MVEYMLNKYYQNVGVKGYFKRYGLVNSVKRGIFLTNSFHLVKDYEIKKVLWQKKATQKIRKYLKYKDHDVTGLRFNTELGGIEPIWVFWNTGIETSPDIVKCCLNSIKKYADREVIFLDEASIDKYVIFPDYIQQKVKNGNIPIAGYTDLMRFALLEHYGGIWIDSTVYLSGPIPNVIASCDFFAPQNSMCLIDNPVLFPAWFLRAKKKNNLIRYIRNVAFAYWTKEDHVIEYLLPNLIITEVIKELGMIKLIPYMNTDYSEYLVRCLGDEYNREKLDWVFKLTSIHKLSYKLDQDIDTFESVYKHLITSEI